MLELEVGYFGKNDKANFYLDKKMNKYSQQKHYLLSLKCF